MKIERQQLFEQLDPPSGGLDRMQRRISESRDARAVIPWQPVLATVMLVLVVVVLTDWSNHPLRNPEMAEVLFDASQFDRLLGRSPRNTELQVVRADQSVQLVQLESSQPNIRIYQVNSGG